MISKSPRFPDIDYPYWCQKNEYFANTPLIDTIKIGLIHARRGGLIDPILVQENIQTNKGLVDLIESQIRKHKLISCFKDHELLLIFDLIQGWGGKTGRNIYVRPLENPTRNALDTLPAIYRKALNHCVSGEYQCALKVITSIPNLGESFATKHIFFWSNATGKALPIYDTRIKSLIFLKANLAANYEVYVDSLNEKSKELNMAPALIERALFSFSQNYFPNGNLLIRPQYQDHKDLIEAQKLQNLYSSYKAQMTPISRQDSIC